MKELIDEEFVCLSKLAPIDMHVKLHLFADMRRVLSLSVSKIVLNVIMIIVLSCIKKWCVHECICMPFIEVTWLLENPLCALIPLICFVRKRSHSAAVG